MIKDSPYYRDSDEEDEMWPFVVKVLKAILAQVIPIGLAEVHKPALLRIRKQDIGEGQ